MSRVLEVAMRNTILALVRQGWSYRRIHRELGVDRETVAKYALLADSKPANLPTGSPDLQVKTGQTCPPGSASVVEPFRQVVEGKLLGDAAIATAILDRFLHHAVVITIKGKSYRLTKRPGPATQDT